MTTFCENCANVERSSRKASPHSWLCLRHPRLDGAGFVSATWWSKNEPFMRCNGINGGACPLFEKSIENEEN